MTHTTRNKKTVKSATKSTTKKCVPCNLNNKTNMERIPRSGKNPKSKTTKKTKSPGTTTKKSPTKATKKTTMKTAAKTTKKPTTTSMLPVESVQT